MWWSCRWKTHTVANTCHVVKQDKYTSPTYVIPISLQASVTSHATPSCIEHATTSARVVLLGTYRVNIRGKRGVARRSLS